MQELLGYVVLYLCIIPFFLGLASGSFEYYVAHKLPSVGEIEDFFLRLPNFAKSMIYVFPYKEWRSYIEKVSKRRSLIVRIFFSIPFIAAVVWFSLNCLRMIETISIFTAIFNLIGIIICILLLRLGWKFGSNLEEQT